MPNGVKLPPHNLIKRLEQPILDRQILHIDLIRLPHLLQARIHNLENGLLNRHHMPRRRNPDVHHLRSLLLELLRHVDMEPRPEVQLPDPQTLHDPLRLGEPGDHGVGLIGEGPDVGAPVEGAEDPDDEGLGGGVGEGVGGEDDEAGDGGGGDFGGEEVDYEDSGGDEEDGAGGVEGVALLGGELGGDVGDSGVGAVVVEDLGFEVGGGGREEEEEGALRWGVEEEE
ncbi:hypothetical protein PanWU01x14_323650 [Parasponia andersonii]|uniref:Uncharacterized protein n=1 Tax=Parasponia andersonii TaxID=3476 RepID=A0A2P5AKF5_PARAD|nr:hypothetical protein PanWU01x14_323650 [Parasponia andersonii]